MADIKISQMTAASTVDDSDVLPVVGNGVTKKVTAETIKDYSTTDVNSMLAPAWSATATYKKNAIVRDNEALYKAKSDVPVGTAPTNTTYWDNMSVGKIIENIYSHNINTLIESGQTCTITTSTNITSYILTLITNTIKAMYLVKRGSGGLMSFAKVLEETGTQTITIDISQANTLTLTTTAGGALNINVIQGTITSISYT